MKKNKLMIYFSLGIIGLAISYCLLTNPYFYYLRAIGYPFPKSIHNLHGSCGIWGEHIYIYLKFKINKNDLNKIIAKRKMSDVYKGDRLASRNVDFKDSIISIEHKEKTDSNLDIYQSSIGFPLIVKPGNWWKPGEELDKNTLEVYVNEGVMDDMLADTQEFLFYDSQKSLAYYVCTGIKI